jgi:hypothetical protein
MFDDPLLARFLPQPQPQTSGLVDMIVALGNEIIGARVRMRALLDLLEEKGVLLPGEFDARAQTAWENDYDDLAQELWESMTGGEEAGGEPED